MKSNTFMNVLLWWNDMVTAIKYSSEYSENVMLQTNCSNVNRPRYLNSATPRHHRLAWAIEACLIASLLCGRMVSQGKIVCACLELEYSPSDGRRTDGRADGRTGGQWGVDTCHTHSVDVTLWLLHHGAKQMLGQRPVFQEARKNWPIRSPLNLLGETPWGQQRKR